MKMILNETQEQRDIELSELIDMPLAKVKKLKIAAPTSIRIYDGKAKIRNKEDIIRLYTMYKFLKFPAYLRTLMKTSAENRHPELYRLIRSTTGKRCLDYGSGVGTHAIALMENRNEVAILDVEDSPLMEFAIQRIYKRGFACPIFYHTKSLYPGFYDVIICTDTLEHIFDPMEAIQNITQGLRSGGILHLQVSNMIKPSSGHFSKSILKWRKFGVIFLKKHYEKIGKTLFRKR